MHFYLHFSRVPLADFHDAKHTTRSMYLDLTKGRLLTCGGDRIVKVREKELLANYIIITMLLNSDFHHKV